MTTAEMRCAMIIFVVSRRAFNVCWISCSVSISSAEVESSKSELAPVFCNGARNADPLLLSARKSDTALPDDGRILFIHFSMKSFACAQSAALRISSNGITFASPILILSVIVSENRNTSCNTTEILLRSCFKESFRTSVPSTFTAPSDTS